MNKKRSYEIISLASHEIILFAEKKQVIILYRIYHRITTPNANQELKGNISGSGGHDIIKFCYF